MLHHGGERMALVSSSSDASLARVELYDRSTAIGIGIGTLVTNLAMSASRASARLRTPGRARPQSATVGAHSGRRGHSAAVSATPARQGTAMMKRTATRTGTLWITSRTRSLP